MKPGCKQYNFLLPIELMQTVKNISNNKTLFVESAIRLKINEPISEPISDYKEKPISEPILGTDAYLQPYINQLKDTITLLEHDKTNLELDKQQLWDEISQLHLNHSKVMDKIISLPSTEPLQNSYHSAGAPTTKPYKAKQRKQINVRM